MEMSCFAYTCSSFASCNLILLAIFVVSRMKFRLAEYDPRAHTLTYPAADGSVKVSTTTLPPPPPDCAYIVEPQLLHPFDPERVIVSNVKIAKLNFLCGVCCCLATYVLVYGERV
jgi:hypothetical protein